MISDAYHSVVVSSSVLQVWHGSETMGLVDDSSRHNLIVGGIILQASVDIRSFHMGTRFGSITLPASSCNLIFGQEGACRATLSLTASPFGDSHFEEQVAGGDWGGE